MIKCPFCGIANVANTLFCSECGQYLLEDKNRATDPLDVDEANKLIAPITPADLSVSGSRINEPRAIRLKIGERHREIEVPLNKVIYLGRVDPGTDIFPDVDLSEHAPAKNISRRHASIQKRKRIVVIEDTGSVNGTYVNGERIEPFLPQILHSGDTLHLGKLRIEVEVLMD